MISLGIALNPQTYTSKWWQDSAVFAAEFTNNRFMQGGSNIARSQILDTARASIGYGEEISGSFIAFANDTARQTDKGLLVEPESSNLALYSQPYDDILIYGGPNGGATRVDINWLGLFTKASQIAVVGGSTAYSYVRYDNLMTGKHRISVYVRASDGVAINISGAIDGYFAAPTIDFSSELTFSNIIQTLVDASIGLYQVSCSVDIASAGSYFIGLNQQAYQAGKTLEWSGIQVEAGEHVTTPIITTGAIAVRDTDTISAPAGAAALAALDHGIILFDVDIANVAASGLTRFLQFDSGVSEIYRMLLFNNNSDWILQITTPNGTVDLLVNSTEQVGQQRFAVGIKLDGTIMMSLNGGDVVSAASGLIDLSVLTRAYLGSGAGVGHMSGYIRSCIIFNEEPTAARVEELSAL